MSKNGGGPAFPDGSPSSGMSLRDYFAAAALQGIYANSNDAFLLTAAKEAESHSESDSAITYARYAYEAADAMLSERDK